MAITKKDLEQENAKLKEHLEATGQKIATLEDAIAQSTEQNQKDAIAAYEDELGFKANGEFIPVELGRRLFKDSCALDKLNVMVYLEGYRVENLQHLIDYSQSIPAIGQVTLAMVKNGELKEMFLGEISLDNYVIPKECELHKKLKPSKVKAIEREIKKYWCASFRVDDALKRMKKEADRKVETENDYNAIASLF